MCWDPRESLEQGQSSPVSMMRCLGGVTNSPSLPPLVSALLVAAAPADIPTLGRRELRPFGVQVSIIEPGGFRTGMIDPKPLVKTFTHLWERLPAETQAAYGRHYLDKCKSIPTPPHHPW